MNRRGFFRRVAGAAVVAAVDTELLLWTPGRKLISIPPRIKIGRKLFVQRFYIVGSPDFQRYQHIYNRFITAQVERLIELPNWDVPK